MSSVKYRPDIDGLRAIAIIPVVAFHAAPGRMPSGFIGVDIFFVISGYLITTIIASQLLQNKFRFTEFYVRRITRIFPALLVVLFTSLVAGSVLFTYEEYEALGQQVSSGAGFYSNFLFWMQSGYFDNASSMKPLLHLWSLSIEEQFYIIWPLILWLSFKGIKRPLLITVSIISLSFMFSIYKADTDLVYAFYSPLTRSWEILIGSLLALLVLNRDNYSAWQSGGLISDLIGLLGAVLLMCGFLMIDEKSAFPGWWALLPVLGSVSLLLAGPQSLINRTVLSNRLLVWFGLISFPLYLVHWPLLAFFRTLESGEVSQIYRVYIVVASIGLAALIYEYIEKPVRFGIKTHIKLPILLLLMATFGACGFYIAAKNGVTLRLGAVPHVVNEGDIGQHSFFSYMDDNFFPCTPLRLWESTGQWEEYTRCYQSHKREINQIAILGNSHAEHLFIGVAESLPSIDVVYYAAGGLPFLRNEKYKQIFDVILNDKNIKMVLVSASWARDTLEISDSDLNFELNQLVEFLLSAGKKVYLIGGIPRFQFEPSKCKYADRFGQVNTCSATQNLTDTKNHDYMSAFHTLALNHPDLSIADMRGFFCDANECFMAQDGNLHFRDSHHLNVVGSQALGAYLIQATTIAQDAKKIFGE